MKTTASIVLIIWLFIGSACAVIAGKGGEEAGAQKPSFTLNFVETFRSEKSLLGEGWREPQPDFRNTPLATQIQQPNSVYADAFRVYVTDTYLVDAAIPNPPNPPILTKSARIFMFERGARAVQIFDNATLASIPPFFEGKLLSPSGIAADAAGVIFVADAQQGKVFGYDRKGRLLMILGKTGDLARPAGLAIDHARNRIYVADSAAQQVKVYTTLGNEALMGNKPLVIGASGDSAADFKFPEAVALDRSGNLYVLDGQRRRVHVYGPEGKFIKKFSLKRDAADSPVKPRGIAVDSDGHIYVADSVGNTVLIYDKDGVLLQTWGRSGGLIGDFWTPSGIFIDGADRVYIADQMNGRVQVFQYSK